MAFLPYIGVSNDFRLVVPAVEYDDDLLTPARFTKGSTDKLATTPLGDWTGRAIWPLYVAHNGTKSTFGTYRNTKELRGFVQNGAGSPIARTVIAISQVDNTVVGSTVSDPSTGAFTLRLTLANEVKVTVIAVPANGDMRNIVAYRDIVPVNPL